MILETAQPPVVVDSLVPIAVSRESQEQPFPGMVRGTKADLQIAGSLCLIWPDPAQWLLTATNTRNGKS